MKGEDGCLRGEVRYSADAEPVFGGVCHRVQLDGRRHRCPKTPSAP